MIIIHDDFKDVYFEFASVIQLGTLRRLANFTFHENYLLSQLHIWSKLYVIFAKLHQNYTWFSYNLIEIHT